MRTPRKVKKADGSKALHEALIAAGFEPSHRLAERSQLSLKETRTTYCMTLRCKMPTVTFQVDGNIIKEGTKCDYLTLINHDVRQKSWSEVFVELKGSDVSHAIDQLETTLQAPVFENGAIENKFARIVATSFPANKSNPLVEKAKRRFQSRFHCELKSIGSCKPDMIDV